MTIVSILIVSRGVFTIVRISSGDHVRNDQLGNIHS